MKTYATIIGYTDEREEKSMKVVVAIDSLKGSLTSMEAGKAIEEGIKNAIPDAEVVVRPIADGGEGTVEAITCGMNGRIEKLEATDPLGRRIKCEYGIIHLEKGQTAVIEMAAVSGLTLINDAERNPYYTTTYGLGEVIKDAIKKGCRHFIIGIGGSATNDGGTGMLKALGFGILDSNGKQIPSGAIGLKDIVEISEENVIPELRECVFEIACDVTNPLCGECGCSVIYGPQKGADMGMIEQMDQWMGHFAKIAKEKYPKANAKTPGTGAAGGLGFAFLTFTNAVLESGIQIVLRETRLEEYIKEADMVVTGEGRLDEQTVMGKAPVGVAAIAKKYEKPVLAFSGCVTENAKLCNEHGIDAFFPILRTVTTLQEAMNPGSAYRNMADTACQVFRLVALK